MRRNLYVAAMAALMVVTTGMTAFAGEWKTDANGKWYVNDDGTYAVNKWVQVDGNWYFADGTGYVMTNGTTPDGYHVDANGIWDGKSQDANTTSTAQAGSGFVDILHAEMSNEETDNVMRAALKEYWSGRPGSPNRIPCVEISGILYHNYMEGMTNYPDYSGMNTLDSVYPFVAKISMGSNWSDMAKYGHEYYKTTPETVKGTLYRTIGVTETERIWSTIVADADRTVEGYGMIMDKNGNPMKDENGVYMREYVNDCGDGIFLRQDFEGTTASGHHYKIFKEDTNLGGGYFVDRNTIVIYKN